MASLQILKSSLSPFSVSQSKYRRKPSCFSSEFNSKTLGKKILKFRSNCSSKFFINEKRFRVYCKLQEGDSQSNAEEPPESLFMKELRKRGMTPSSLLEESNRSIYGDEEIKLKEEDGGFSKRNAVSTDIGKSLSNQRERSMALNSEGLEGLIPRGRLLLTLGGTFFLGFGPSILITVAFFSALYFYFGETFVHDGNRTPIAPPQYIDPYALLEDERLSQTAPRVN
uniref:Tubulin alpha-6 chain n=1 Tax=Davidia involucrata TaxID=16924 RepID=A0A5B6ZZP8_DAVIN